MKKLWFSYGVWVAVDGNNVKETKDFETAYRFLFPNIKD